MALGRWMDFAKNHSNEIIDTGKITEPNMLPSNDNSAVVSYDEPSSRSIKINDVHVVAQSQHVQQFRPPLPPNRIISPHGQTYSFGFVASNAQLNMQSPTSEQR